MFNSLAEAFFDAVIDLFASLLTLIRMASLQLRLTVFDLISEHTLISGPPLCFLCCLTLITRWRYVSMHCLSWNGGHMYFHRTVRYRAVTVWRRCSVAIDVVVDRWRVGLTLRGGSGLFAN